MLGTAIGVRTWGGEIWLSGANRLSDVGLARAPMMGVYGECLIEGHGCEPDIVVEGVPNETFNREDAQVDVLSIIFNRILRKIPGRFHLHRLTLINHLTNKRH